jgi:hypothetical protein
MKRPIRITLLAIIVFFVSVGNGLRLGETIFFWYTLAEYGAHPFYMAISGAVWLTAGLSLVWGLWQGKAWGWVVTLGGLIGYTIWFWFDRLVIQKPHANLPFVLTGYIVLLTLILIILFSRKTRRFFQKDTHER